MLRLGKVISFYLVLLTSFATQAGQQQVLPQASEIPAFSADQVIVGFQPGTPAAAIAEAHRQAGGRVHRTLNAIGVQLVTVPAQSVLEKVGVYQRNPNIRFAEPNYLRPMLLPDEGTEPWPYQPGEFLDMYNEQWGLDNNEQSFYYDGFTLELGVIKGAADADIDAPEGWDISTGRPDVVIAVLDSGIECSHPDLLGKCIEQMNFGPSDYGTTDILGHGTHVAGIAAANTNNDHGVAGVGWNSSLASLKVCYEYYDLLFGWVGLCDSFASAEAMIHAADNGYQVINMSYAGPAASTAEQDAATYAWNKNVVLVAAAANNYSTQLMYPAAFPEVIATAATDWYDNLAYFSNFGTSWVALAAPGDNSFSTYSSEACGGASDCYHWLSGTSMASPHVAGAAAVVWAHLVDTVGDTASNADVRAALEGGADSVGALGQNMLAWTQNGRLNLHGALTYTSSPAPPPPPSGQMIMYVSDLDGTSSPLFRGKWDATVTITVYDGSDNAVVGADITGAWSDGATGSASCKTGDEGKCSISKSNLKQNIPSVTFTVTDIIHSTLTYVELNNLDSDNDSDGTVIKIAQ